ERFPEAEVVLLGSIASAKYVDLLLDIFDDRLLFPADFAGRGGTRRGGARVRGSTASAKYADLLLDIFDARLLCPVDFVGRGDMSRGGLLLRSARAGTELPYRLVRGGVRPEARPH